MNSFKGGGGPGKTDMFFMEKALALASDALDAGEFPVGCVITAGSAIVATGERKGSGGLNPNEVDHAEMVALRRLAGKPAATRGSLTLYATLEPCLMCFGAILLSGIDRIVYAYEDVMGGGTACDLMSLTPLYRDRVISVVPHVGRAGSLALFKRFFADPDNTYWENSILSEYTLAQS